MQHVELEPRSKGKPSMTNQQKKSYICRSRFSKTHPNWKVLFYPVLLCRTTINSAILGSGNAFSYVKIYRFPATEIIKAMGHTNQTKKMLKSEIRLHDRERVTNKVLLLYVEHSSSFRKLKMCLRWCGLKCAIFNSKNPITQWKW